MIDEPGLDDVLEMIVERRDCPWCRAQLQVQKGSPFVPSHAEGTHRWPPRRASCRGSGVSFAESEALARIRDDAGGEAFLLRAHP